MNTFAPKNFALFALIGLVAACDKPAAAAAGQPAPAAAASTAAAAEAAANAAVPGSHQDWCAEHNVPESQCTLCHPELAAAFKATGDWCKEHGLPESHCRTCNPKLKLERPAKAQEK